MVADTKPTKIPAKTSENQCTPQKTREIPTKQERTKNRTASGILYKNNVKEIPNTIEECLDGKDGFWGIEIKTLALGNLAGLFLL